MVSHDWLCAWWEGFARDSQCRVIAVWCDGELVAAAPFMYRTLRLFLRRRRVLTLFANTWVDRMQLLVTPPGTDLLSAILAHLEKIGDEYDLLDLYPLGQGSGQTQSLVAVARQRGWRVGVEDHLQSPRMALPVNWDGLLEGLSSTFRQTVRRKVRKLEKTPQVTMRVLTDVSCISLIENISAETWQADAGSAMSSQENVWKFYRQVITAEAEAGNLRCAIMEVGGEPAAFELNIVHRQTIHNLKLGFKKRFSDLSSGIVLKSFLLKSLMEEVRESRLEEYDFMGAAEPYKLHWTKEVRSHGHYYFFPPDRDWSVWYWAFFVLKPFLRDHLATPYGLLKRVLGRFHQAS